MLSRIQTIEHNAYCRAVDALQKHLNTALGQSWRIPQVELVGPEGDECEATLEARLPISGEDVYRETWEAVARLWAAIPVRDQSLLIVLADGEEIIVSRRKRIPNQP